MVIVDTHKHEYFLWRSVSIFNTKRENIDHLVINHFVLFCFCTVIKLLNLSYMYNVRIIIVRYKYLDFFPVYHFCATCILVSKLLYPIILSLCTYISYHCRRPSSCLFALYECIHTCNMCTHSSIKAVRHSPFLFIVLHLCFDTIYVYKFGVYNVLNDYLK